MTPEKCLRRPGFHHAPHFKDDAPIRLARRAKPVHMVHEVNPGLPQRAADDRPYASRSAAPLSVGVEGSSP
jgi:hypothetical protein